MDLYAGQTELKCNVVTSPAVRPQMFRQLSRRPHIQETVTENEATFEQSGGTLERFNLGDGRHDLSLSVKNLTEADVQFLHELKRRARSAYIYSSVPGSILHYIPLRAGVGGDPTDAVYTGTLAADTTVYVPRLDVGTRWYLEEVDYTSPVTLDAVEYNPAGADAATDDTRETSLPLGRGIMLIGEYENVIENSLFVDNNTLIHNWTFSGTGTGINRKVDVGWMGVPSLQIWGTTDNWLSHTVTLTGAAVGDKIAVSYGWKSDAECLVGVWLDNGTPVSTGSYAHVGGSGYEHQVVTIPSGYAACNVVLKFSLNSGTFGEFCAPQVCHGGGAYNIEYVPVFIAGEGDGIQGAITATQLKATGQYQPIFDNQLLIATTYFAPMWPEDSPSDSANRKRVLTLHNSITSKEVSLHLGYDGSVMKAYVRYDGSPVASVEIVGMFQGQILACALYVGRISTTMTVGCRIRIVGGSTSYSASHASGTSIFDELYIGVSEGGTNWADAVLSDAVIWVGDDDMITDSVAYMADKNNLMEHRETYGRRYFLYPSFSPSPWNRGRYDGTINCVQEKTL